MKKFLLAPLVLALSACNIILSDDDKVNVSESYDFQSSDGGWQGAFSDYPKGQEEFYELSAGVQKLPQNDEISAFVLSGNNHSDDLLMYMKKKVTGLTANTRYQLVLSTKMWSIYGDGCFGIGGSPGNSVYIKAGASNIEPKQANYYMNIDLGSQSQGGADGKVLGDVAIKDIDCSGSQLASKVLKLESTEEFEVISSANGELWVYVASDSGFEGTTTLYFDEVEFTLTAQ